MLHILSILLVILIVTVQGYIRHDSSGSTNFTYFTPYAQGFVGVYGEPSNFMRERINEGSFENPAKELIYEQAITTQTCPGMVGPFTDGNYFCTAKEYGYCDRRSGVCFCNIGYQGIDCSDCTPSYFKVENLCYPKKLCPNDCSGAGECQYWTGTCECLPHRVGADCGTLLCKSFNELCEACSTTQCLRCPAGYYLTETNDCRSCYDYDPRCAGCTKDLGCTLCADPILTSVRRSGYRNADPRLPVEEDSREFSITLPFGTKSPESFADAEAFIVATTPDKPLREKSVSCHQGLNNDENWHCEDLLASHIVCGHKGVFSFTYPNYVINETSRFFRVSVRRSGGGYGNVLVNYFIKHYTTSDNDLTATAPYTTSQTLYFDEGVVERSFLVSIIDDNIVEENEVFQIVLELPEGGGSIGAQFRTNVTIVDDDLYLLSPVFTTPKVKQIVSVAGDTFTVPIQAIAANGVDMTVGGERFLAVIENDIMSWASSDREYSRDGQRHTLRTLCTVRDEGNGTYSIDGKLLQQGKYQLRVWHAFPLGLMGTYHRDAFMENVALERIDRFVNFTWGEGRLLPRGADYISIRWAGVIRPDTSDDYLFRVDADDHARLWIDGNLLVDHWHEQRADLEPYRSVTLVKDFLYEVVLEYREVRGDAYARLMWTSLQNFNETLRNNGTELESFVVIPPENMYSLHEIGNSPIDVIVTSTDTSAPHTECSGDGIFHATVLQPSHFTFCPRDEYRNYRDDVDKIFLASELFNVSLVLVDDVGHGGSGREVVYPEITYDADNSCFEATYVPDRAGVYKLSILHHSWHGLPGTHVAGSPFLVTVSPNVLNGPYSPIYGIPTPFYTVAGECYNFTVVAKDGSHNLILAGGENIQVYMYRVAFFQDSNEEALSTELYERNSDTVRYGTVYDHQNGNYSVELCPTITGWYEVHVLANGRGVSNIPFRVQELSASKGVAMGLSPGSSFRGQYIYKSPYELYTSSGNIASMMSTVEVVGNLAGCTVGVVASFVITCRDNWGNVVRTQPDKTVVSAKLLLSPNAMSESFDLGNGSYRIQFTPEKAGPNLIQVLVNDSPIQDSPFSVVVEDGIAESSFSYVRGRGISVGRAGEISSFVVYSKDLNDNMKTDASDNYTFTISATERIVGSLKPCGGDVESLMYCGAGNDFVGGVYYATYIPTIAGDMTLSVYLNNENGQEHVMGSPFQVRIHPGSPHAASTLVSGILHNATVGIEYYVRIHLVDQYGNKLESGGHDVELLLGGVAGDWGTIEPYGTLPGLPNMYYYSGHFGVYPDVSGIWIDHGDGGYTSSYTLTTTGLYVARLSVAEQGLNATYFNDTSFGYLATLDDNLDSFDKARNGHDVNTGSTISWTGDIGRRPGSKGDLQEGSYFHKFKSRVESTVGFDLRSNEGTDSSNDINNTVFSVGDKFREDYWSMRYIGLINPEYAETYNFTILADAESFVSLRIGGVGSATNGSNPGEEVVLFNPNASIASGQYTFTDVKYREFVLEYIHTKGPETFLTVYWESPSTPKSLIPSSAFRHWENISHHNVTANPNTLCSRCSTVHGNALTTAVVGTSSTFTLYARDYYGNLLQTGGDVPSMLAVGPNGVSFRGVVEDFGNSTYHISYYPTQSGVYRMYISVGCCPPHPNVGVSREIDLIQPLLIASAPFNLHVSPGIIHGPKTIAVGPGLLSGRAGYSEEFKILYRDIHGNPTSDAPDVDISVSFTLGRSHSTVVNHMEHWLTVGSSNATVRYNITSAGNYSVAVLVNGVDILGSPFFLTIRPASAAPDKTVVRGLGKSVATVQREAQFEVVIKDMFNNVISNGGHRLFVRLFGSHRREDSKQVVVPHCKDGLDGKYNCRYIPHLPGQHELKVMLLSSPADHPGGSGLWGYYYSHFGGVDLAWNGTTEELRPIVARVDPSIDFYFPTGFFLDVTRSERSQNIVGDAVERVYTSSDFVSGVRIVWEGYLVSPFSDEVSFKVISSHFNATVFIDNTLVFDSTYDDLNTRDYRSFLAPKSTVTMATSSVYAIKVEALSPPESIVGTDVTLKLTWSTSTTRESVVPSFFLFHTAEDVLFSPFPVEISGVE